jgi:hypothetical protein
MRIEINSQDAALCVINTLGEDSFGEDYFHMNLNQGCYPFQRNNKGWEGAYSFEQRLAFQREVMALWPIGEPFRAFAIELPTKDDVYLFYHYFRSNVKCQDTVPYNGYKISMVRYLDWREWFWDRLATKIGELYQ